MLHNNSVLATIGAGDRLTGGCPLSSNPGPDGSQFRVPKSNPSFSLELSLAPVGDFTTPSSYNNGGCCGFVGERATVRRC